MPLRNPPDSPAPPHANPEDHAVLIGVQDYTGGIDPLQGAINDCDLFSRWLTDRKGGGLDPANIKCICSTPNGTDPFRDQVENLLLEYLETRSRTGVEVGRRLYLFFSGHGVAPPPPLDDDCALVMANASLRAVRALIGGLAARTVRKAALFKEVMLVMDCCSGVSGNISASFETASFPADPTLPPRPFCHVFAASWASTAAELNLPDPLDPARPSSWHGVLTHALIRGLQTACDENGDVTAKTLEDFIRRAVENMLGEGNQHWPTTDWDEKLPAMHFGRSDGVPVVVRVADPAAQLRVTHGTNMAVVAPRQEAVAGGTKVWLRPGLYLFDAVDGAGNVVASKNCKVLEAVLDVTL
jgi:hypothetical protein